MHYRCAVCSLDFPAKDVQVDHIKPIVSVSAGFKTWDDFIDKLFCEAKNLQVLCKPCHKVKTGKERKKRG
jgi:5-methylcytosine-specific restriction endonuclease McrA